MVRQATEKYDIGNIVQGSRGGVFEIFDINKENGLITVYTVSAQERRKQYKFAFQLAKVINRGTKQKTLDLPDAAEEVSFEQIIKRYR